MQRLLCVVEELREHAVDLDPAAHARLLGGNALRLYGIAPVARGGTS